MEKVSLKDKTVMYVDFGLFIEAAITISKSFKKVYFHNPSWKNGFPKSNGHVIGYGVKEIEVCHDMWDVFDEIDLFIFPDVYMGDLQVYLRSVGKRVFGGGKGEEGELDRVAMKEHMKELKLPVGDYAVVTGTKALREYLKTHKEQWVKISALRGNMETFFSPYYEFVEPKLDELEYKLGPVKYIQEFVIEANLPDKVEIGYDGFTIDGQYPVKCITGIEVKDVGYIGITKNYKDLPKEITDFNAKMAPTFKQWTYRGCMSTELRVGKDHKAYQIDLCFSSDTEILTDSGWKLFKDLDKTEKVLTKDKNSDKISFEYPTDYINYTYTGKMHVINNGSLQSVHIPEHLLWADIGEGYKLLPSKDIFDKDFNIQTLTGEYIIDKNRKSIIDYNGIVYCVTVPGSILYVRNRKGVTTTEGYFSGNCSRFGSPPSELYQNMYKNLAEIMWYGAEGIMIEPIIEGKFGVEVLIHSTWADQNWQQVEFPEEYRENIKLRNLAIIEGEYYAVPQAVGLPEIGAVVASGETLDEAVNKVKKIAETVKGFYLECKMESIDQAIAEFKKLEGFGIKLM